MFLQIALSNEWWFYNLNLCMKYFFVDLEVIAIGFILVNIHNANLFTYIIDLF